MLSFKKPLKPAGGWSSLHRVRFPRSRWTIHDDEEVGRAYDEDDRILADVAHVRDSTTMMKMRVLRMVGGMIAMMRAARQGRYAVKGSSIAQAAWVWASASMASAAPSRWDAWAS
jgi:hypothetical protein